jgi:hypothetical protein
MAQRKRRITRKRRSQRFTAKGRHTPSVPSRNHKGRPINSHEVGKKPGDDQPMIPCPPHCPEEGHQPIYGGEYIEGETGWGGMGGGGGTNNCPYTYCTTACEYTNQSPWLYTCHYPAGAGGCCYGTGGNCSNGYNGWPHQSGLTEQQCNDHCQGTCFCGDPYQVDAGGQYGWAWEATIEYVHYSQCIGNSHCCTQGSQAGAGSNNCPGSYNPC